MRLLFSFLVLSIACFFDLQGQTDLPVNVNAEHMPLTAILADMEARYDLAFSYSDNLLEDIVVTIRAKEESLDIVLHKLLRDTKLDHRFVRERFILLVPQETEDITDVIVPIKTRNYLLQGAIVDAITLEPLPFATIKLLSTGQGVNSQTDGAFALNVRTLPTDSVEVSYVGYETQRFAIINTDGQSLDIRLQLASVGLANVVVTAYLTEGIQAGDELGQIRFSPDRIDVLPGQAEPDILQGVLLLPGISSPSESVADINIRGGTADQNLVLYDGIPVYHTGHYFGSITAFNPYIVDKVDIWRGGHGAQYGGRVSGVIDIQTPSEVSKDLKAGAGLNLTHGHVFWELPMAKKQLSWMFSARRSFTDFFPTVTFTNYQQKVFQGSKIDNDQRSQFDDLRPVTDRFYFQDLHTKLIWQISTQDQLNVSYFTGQNSLDFVLAEEDGYRVADNVEIGNRGGQASWQHQWSKQWQADIHASHSFFDYRSGFRESLNDTFELERIAKFNTLTDDRLRMQLQWQPNEAHQLTGGAEWVDYTFGFSIDYQSIYEGQYAEKLENNVAVSAAFIDYAFQDQQQKWVAQFGLRSANVPSLGQRFWEPRLGLDVEVSTGLRFKATAGRNHQFVSQLIEAGFNGLGVNNQIWAVVDDDDIAVLKGWQQTAGFDMQLKGWYLDIEAYARQLTGLTSFARAFSSLEVEDYSRGKGRTRGIDLLLRKRWKNHHTWISYTHSRSEYLFEDFDPDWIPAFNDIRHQFSWVYMWRRKPIDISVGWYFHSGKPYSPLTDIDIREIEEEEDPYILTIPVQDDINADYLPAYHRLDVSAVYTFAKRKERSPQWQLGMSAINIYNRTNLVDRIYQDIVFESDEEPEERVGLLEKSLLPFTPNLFVRVEW